jgi:hypothetical protein
MVCIATIAGAGDVEALPLLSVTVIAAGDAEALDDVTTICELLLEPTVIGLTEDSVEDSTVSGESISKRKVARILLRMKS